MIQATQTATIQPEHPLTTAVFPRFTPQEAIILNTIVSASPGYVTTGTIIRRIETFLVIRTQFDGPNRDSIMKTVSTIRAKLGEPKNHPYRLISVYEIQENGRRGLLLGYAWKG